MFVRAKFKYTGYETSLSSTYPHKTPEGKIDTSRPEVVELRTLKLSPVYGNGDPEHENTKFWQYSPSGSISLGTVNPAAWEQFEMGKEYYIDFTPADG
jgi:hypothetical protein